MNGYVYYKLEIRIQMLEVRGQRLEIREKENMKDFRKMQVWHNGHKLALDIYKLTAKFPKEEIYGLTSQIRRAAVSIPANIAEGCGRGSTKELKHFLSISMGSASEVEYQILLSYELSYMDSETYDSLNSDIQEIKKMLSNYIVKII